MARDEERIITECADCGADLRLSDDYLCARCDYADMLAGCVNSGDMSATHARSLWMEAGL